MSGDDLPYRVATFEERRHGASDAPTIMGVNPWDSTYQLYHRSKGSLPDREVTLNMRLGHYLQPGLIRAFSDETGRKAQEFSQSETLISVEFPWMSCTPDAYTEGELLEIKNVGPGPAPGWANGDPPLYVQVQLQHQMIVTGIKAGWICALVMGCQLNITRHEFDPEFAAMYIEKLERFHRDVVAGRDPTPSELDSGVPPQLFPTEDPGAVVELPTEAVGLTDELDRLMNEATALNKTITEKKTKIQHMIGIAEKGVLPDGTGWTWKTVKRKAYEVAASESRVLRRAKR